MGKSWSARVLCLLTVAILIVLCGCTDVSPRRARRHRYAVNTDFERMKDDIDWLLGIHRPVLSYDETMR